MENANMEGTEEERAMAQEMAGYAEELIKEFPEVTVRSWAFNYELKNGQWLAPGVHFELTGPEMAVNAFLAILALSRDVDSVQIFQPIDPETGRTFNKPVKDFTARMRPPKVQ